MRSVARAAAPPPRESAVSLEFFGSERPLVQLTSSTLPARDVFPVFRNAWQNKMLSETRFRCVWSLVVLWPWEAIYGVGTESSLSANEYSSISPEV